MNKYRPFLLAFVVVAAVALFLKLRSSAPAAPAPGTSSSSSGITSTIATQLNVIKQQFGRTSGGMLPGPVRGYLQPLGAVRGGSQEAPGRGSQAAVVAPQAATSQIATSAADTQAHAADPLGLAALGIVGLPIGLN